MSHIFLNMTSENPAISSKTIQSDIDDVNMLRIHRGIIYSIKLERLVVMQTQSNLNFIWLYHPIGVNWITFNQNKYKLFNSKTILLQILHNWVFFPLRLSGIRILIDKSEISLSLPTPISHLPCPSIPSSCLNS